MTERVAATIVPLSGHAGARARAAADLAGKPVVERLAHHADAFRARGLNAEAADVDEARLALLVCERIIARYRDAFGALPDDDDGA